MPTTVGQTTAGHTAPPTPPPVDHILNLQTLKNLAAMMGDDREAINDLLHSFMSETPRLLDALGTHIAQGQVNDVRRAAHTLKSTSAMFGATRLSELAADMENRGRSGTLADAADLLAAMYNEYDRACTALQTYLGVVQP